MDRATKTLRLAQARRGVTRERIMLGRELADKRRLLRADRGLLSVPRVTILTSPRLDAMRADLRRAA